MIFRTLLLSIFALSLTIANADLVPLPTIDTTYEDAEDNNTDGWDIYDNTPAGATITNFFDSDSNSNVIKLLGGATANGYRLGHNNANNVKAWGNTSSTIISWDSKFSEGMVVYVPVQTTDGFRYLYYTASNTDYGINSNPTYVHHGIGSNQRNGAWHRTARDLQADLNDFEPSNQIISVNGILIRGSGLVDNIVTLTEMPPVPPVPEQVVYEDAQDGNTNGWDVYDKTPAGATVENVLDEGSNRVIDISGEAGTRNNGYRLGHNNANSPYAWNDTAHKVISWDGKFDDNMVVYIPVQTTFGFRYLYYTAMNSDRGISPNWPKYIHHGMGANKRDGTWRTTYRDLEADLKEFEPDNDLISVNGFLIRGNGQLDNIQTSNTMPVVPPVPAEIIYEDAENGNTAGWDVYDKTPAGATFSNIDDLGANGTKVIELSGSATSNGYRLGHNNANHPNAWYNKDHKTISWDSQFGESMVIYIPVMTEEGFRYLFYTAKDSDDGLNTHGVNNTVYIHHGIGVDQKDGTWRTNVRDLEADLKEFEPNNHIITVNGILIRGSGRVDNIKLSGDVSPPETFYEIKFVNDLPATQVPRNLSASLFEQGLALIASVVDGDGNTVVGAVPTYDISTVDLTTVGEYSLRFTFYYTGDSGSMVVIKDLPVFVENHLPLATGQTVTVDEDTSDNPITLTGSDSNVGDTLTYAIATPPTNGALSGTAPNLTYTPNPDFAGTDSFTFTLSDNTETSAPATVTINVTDVPEPNAAPEAVAQSVSLNEDGTINITILGTDADGDPLHYAVTSSQSNGFLSGSTGGTSTTGITLIYAPNLNYFGTDSFEFTVSDGQVTSAPATVSITIASVNDVPTIGSLSRIYLDEDSADNAINLVVNDVENDALTYTIDGPSNGALGGTAPNLTYTPNENYWGMDSFTVTASDGADSSARTIDITVNSINDAPKVNAGEDVTVQVNSAVTLTGEVSDIDGDSLTYQWFDGEAAITGATSAQLSYTPSLGDVGTHTLTLTVTDNGNPVATASDTVEVTVTIPGSYSISLAYEGDDIFVGTSQAIFEEDLFDNGAVEDDEGNNIPEGNDIVFATAYSGTVDLNTVGTYYIRLEYTDPFGRLVQSAPIEIRVIEAPVVATFVTGTIRDTSGELLNNILVQAIAQNGEVISEFTNVSALPLPDNDGEGPVQVSLPPGLFLLDSIPADTNITLKFTHNDFATQILPIKTLLSGETPINLDITLIPRGAVQAVTTSGEVAGDQGAKVTVSENAFVDQDNNPVSITDGINVTITPVDISTPVGVAVFPGDFLGYEETDGVLEPIVSYGTVEYVFTRISDGEVLQLADGQKADIEIPLYITAHQDGSVILAGDTIPLWSLDETTGIWQQEGSGTVVVSSASPTGLALRAEVYHFTWWNADAVMNPAFATVTVTAPEAGTALVKIRTTNTNVGGWRSDAVNTVIDIGGTTEPLPIPSNSEVCFWAEITFDSGSSATTPEVCETVAASTTQNISLEIVGGTLSLSASPSANITAYIGVAPAVIKVHPTTAESSVSYVIESGVLPAGVSLNASNVTGAIITGVPTEVGVFDFVINGTDADGNTVNLAFSYTVNDGVAPPNLSGGVIRSDGSFDVYDMNNIQVQPDLGENTVHDISLANTGGVVTNWEISFESANTYKKILVFEDGQEYLTSQNLENIDISQFDYSISASGLLEINNWPIDLIATEDSRGIWIDATVTATNTSGTVSKDIYIYMDNNADYPTGPGPGGPSVCENFNSEEEMNEELDYLQYYLQDLDINITERLYNGADESDPVIQDLRAQISDIENEITQLEACLYPNMLNGEVTITGTVISSNGDPVANKSLYIDAPGSEGTSALWTGVTDEDGRFTAIYEVSNEDYARFIIGDISTNSDHLVGVDFQADVYSYSLGNIIYDEDE